MTYRWLIVPILLALAGCVSLPPLLTREKLPPTFLEIEAAGFSISDLLLPDPEGFRSHRLQAPENAKDTEQIVRSLAWLKSRQKPDGSWASGQPIGTTALCLLAFLGHGSAFFGEALERAKDYLVSSQGDDGVIGPWNAQTTPYAHALATQALAEYQLLHPEENLHRELDSAASRILSGQQQVGGWSYGYRLKGRRDTSITICQIEALWMARMAGVRRTELDRSILAGLRDLVSVQDAETGGFGYQFKRIGSTGITSAAIYAMQLTGLGNRGPARLGLYALDTDYEMWRKPTESALFAAYYTAQAAFRKGGVTWRNYFPLIRSSILERVRDDGSWEPVGKEKKHGAAYATALCTLMLETPRRSTPRASESGFPPLVWSLSSGEARSFIAVSVPIRKGDLYLLNDSLPDL